MTRNSARKQAARTLAADQGIAYADALRRVTAPSPDNDEPDAYERLKALGWDKPVGDSPMARQVALSRAQELTQHSFAVAHLTKEQFDFLVGLVPAAAEHVTLAHLALSYPGPTPASTTPPTPYYCMHLPSRALVTIYKESEHCAGYCCYVMREELPRSGERENDR